MDIVTPQNQHARHYVAVVTPFKDNFEVDEAALRRHLRYFMQPAFKNAGGAVIINPEAGELFYLSREEKRRNVEIAMEECGRKVPVFAGAIDLRTEDAVKVAVDAREAGADGLFLLPPIGMMDITSCWDPEKYPEIWIDMAKAQASAAGLPAIVHPVAGRTPAFGIGLPLAPALLMCREIPEIVGWKMTYSYEGTKIVAKGLKTLQRQVAVLIATGRYFHDHLATGILEGTLSGSYNYAMESMMAHLEAWKKKDVAEATQIWDSGLYDLHAYIYSDYSRLHVRYKLATWLRGLIPSPFMRPPQPEPRREEIQMLSGLVKKTGLSMIEADALDHVAKRLKR
ncbi:MAG TPA: dihydrodipicolinate synthase family protein [Verrucomicrobiae bacterium]|jgi:dihydrodipicolinate synthase/N-acetylneuraminate lyase|nr:dihydrodipicolinate synthase family protein [Verrucomicrobiae bacterium]